MRGGATDVLRLRPVAVQLPARQGSSMPWSSGLAMRIARSAIGCTPALMAVLLLTTANPAGAITAIQTGGPLDPLFAQVGRPFVSELHPGQQPFAQVPGRLELKSRELSGAIGHRPGWRHRHPVRNAHRTWNLPMRGRRRRYFPRSGDGRTEVVHAGRRSGASVRRAVLQQRAAAAGHRGRSLFVHGKRHR